MEGRARPTGQRHRLAQLLLIGIALAALLGWQQWTSPGAAAASWTTLSITDCVGYPNGSGWIYKPRGFSQLGWDGYFYYSTGETYGTLWRWNAGAWGIWEQGYGSGTGSTGAANFRKEGAYSPTDYYTSGSHGSSFFPGWVPSESNTISCI